MSVDGIRGHENGAQRHGVFDALALRPLPAGVDGLVVTFGEVVGGEVSADRLKGFLSAFEVGGLLADDDSQFDLPVELLRPRRNTDRIIGAGDRVGGLEEDDGLFGRRIAGLGGVLDIVLANADHC